MKMFVILILIFIGCSQRAGFEFHALGQEPYAEFHSRTVGIKKKTFFLAEKTDHCTGVVIAPDKVITHRSCTEGAIELEVFQGVMSLRESGGASLPFKFPIKRIDSFEELSLINLNVKHSKLKPTPIYEGDLDEGESKEGGETILVVGYGDQQNNGLSVGTPLQFLTYLKFEGPHYFSAFSGETWTGACRGDEGAPGFVYRDKTIQLAGVYDSPIGPETGACNDKAQKFISLKRYKTFIESDGSKKIFDEVTHSKETQIPSTCHSVQLTVSDGVVLTFVAKSLAGSFLGLAHAQKEEETISNSGWIKFQSVLLPQDGTTNIEKWRLNLNENEFLILRRNLWQPDDFWHLDYSVSDNIVASTTVECD